MPRIAEEQPYNGVLEKVERLGLTGDVDWTKCLIVDGTRVCVGVEIQLSARSDLVVVDLIHLRKALTEGKIDVAALVVPSDRLGVFLTDRGPKIADAKRHVREARADDLPLLLVALEHDGPGPALAKQRKGSRSRQDCRAARVNYHRFTATFPLG